MVICYSSNWELIQPKNMFKIISHYLYIKNPYIHIHIYIMQIKTMMKYHYTPVSMAKIKNTDNIRWWQECRAQICTWHHHYGRKPRGNKEPLDEGKRGEGKSCLKTQNSNKKDHGIWSHHFMVDRKSVV